MGVWDWLEEHVDVDVSVDTGDGTVEGTTRNPSGEPEVSGRIGERTEPRPGTLLIGGLALGVLLSTMID